MGAQCCRGSALEKYEEGASSPAPAPSSKARGHASGGRRSEKPAGRSITFAAYTQGGKSDEASQDQMLAAHKFGGNPAVHLFAVFDGHGEYGGEVSSFLKRNFPIVLQNEKGYLQQPVLALKDTCVKVNSMLKATGLDLSLSGSTGCVCLVINSQLFTCNVGDSRAIAGVGLGELPKPVQLTTDHTASNPKEKARIVHSRGRVIKNRIYTADSNLPGLIPSRSFGDLLGVKAGVVCQPDVCVYKVTPEYRFLAIMSDGVWENVSGAHVAKHVVLSDTLSIAAREVVKDAERAVHAGNKYRDDMTAVLVEFHGFGQSNQKEEAAADDFLKDPNDRVAFAVSICQELVAQGVHPEDAPDAIMGLTPPQRQRVVEAISRSHAGGSLQPGVVGGEQSPGPIGDSSGESSSKPWYLGF